MTSLADFRGLWSLSRRIEDARAGAVLTLTGTARFADDGHGLTCDEAGTLVRPGQPPMAATRRYLWRQEGGRIRVLFADGRPFHDFAPGASARAAHACAPDAYAVAYDFSHWPAWRAEWTVRGPRKDYVMRSHYRPAG
ncbi:trigger factor [Rhodobacteraceae bacterium 2CG4]|uniref:Trigger factor n=1 Tax=Halovulum marinum TaxID=2662447 RepID=A0A6L5Z5Y0_9RHOB|nr:trigger factor [Halovulum marinum]